MRRPAQFIIVLGAVLGLSLAAGTADATLYFWDNATGGHPTGGTGWWTNAANKNVWWNGTSDVTWPNLQSPRDCATFSGTSGTVTLAATIYAGAVNFETAGYAIVLLNSNILHVTSFGGSQLSATTLQPNGSNQRLYCDDAVNPTTFNGIVNFTATFNKDGPGTLVVNLASITGTGSFGVYNGALVLDGSVDTGTGNQDTKVVGATSSVPSVFAGTGSLRGKGFYVQRAGESADLTVTSIFPGVLSPGDCTTAAAYAGGSHVYAGNPIPTFGPGVLTLLLNRGSSPAMKLQFTGSTLAFPDCASILLMDIQGNAGPGVAGGYDQVALTSNNNVASGHVLLTDCSTTNPVGAKLCLNWNKAGYAGVRGDFLKLINDCSSIVGIKGNFSYPDTGATINNFDCVIFTNNVGKGFLFQYRYNFDVLGTQNDFGLYDNETLVTNAGGAYANVGASSINLNGSATLDSGISGSSITAYNWDFDNNGTTDLTGQTPSVNKAYFTSTFGWADGSVHNIVLDTIDSNGVSSWGTTTLTLSSGAAPEPATWALMGTGALIAVGFVRRKRMK